METSSPVRVELAHGLAHLVLDAVDRTTNVMDDAYGTAMEQAVDHLASLVRDRRIRGVVIRSAKSTFFAGGDLDAMIERPRTAQAWRWRLEQVQRPLRILEALPVPVVAAINGAAVGGGLEIALAAHARVAVRGDYPIGLPEVTLGLLAAGGGISRSARLLGLRRALTDVLLPGATVGPDVARRWGIIDHVVDHDPVAGAIQLSEAFARRPPRGCEAMSWLPALRARVDHGLPDAPRALLEAAVAGAGAYPEEAQRHEVEAFIGLVAGPQFGLTLRAAHGDRRRVLAAVPREDPVDPAPTNAQFMVAGLPATRFGPDLRSGVVEIVVPASAWPVEDQARRAVRAWGGCAVLSRRSSYVGRLVEAMRAEVRAIRADGIGEDVLSSALLRLGMGAPVADPLPVGDVADRLAVAVSLAALTALARGTIGSVAEADLASVAGLGFPRALGGAVAHALHHVEGTSVTGLTGFERTLARLARRHGDRFVLPPDVRALAHQLADQEEAP